MKFTEYVEVNPKTNLKKGEYAPFVEMANVSITYREPEKIEYKKYTSGPKFQNGDSVVARIEPCLQNGKRFFWKSDKIGFGSTEYIVFRAKEGKMDSKYLFYLLKTDYIKKSMVSSMVGATGRQRVNNDIFGQIEIVVPNIEKQKKIGKTLFLYDDLIENNQKQIKLLEEAAQRLYKEWFVDLRFPGHENTKIVDGVPEGWNESTVESFGTVITGKTPPTSNKEYYTNGKVPFVTIPDMHNVVYPLKTEKRLTIEGAQTQKNKYIPPNSVMISCIGTVGLVCIATEVCQTNQQINSIILNNEDDLYFFYESMLRMKDLLDGLGSNGATMTNVNKSKLEKLIIISPSKDIVK